MDESGFVGREFVVGLVRDLAERPEQAGWPVNRHAPVLLVEGGRASGRTALLTGLDDLMDNRIPHAYLDLGTGEAEQVPAVLAALAFKLSRHVPGYGRLRFPRLVLAQLVMALPPNREDHAAARAAVVRLLSQRRGIDAAVEVLQEAAGTLLPNLPVPLPPKSSGQAVLAAVRRLGEWAPAGRLVLGRYQAWYAHQGGGDDAIDNLVELSDRARPPVNRANQMFVDRLLLSAFLADVQDAFGRRRTAAGRQSLGCVVLLDNADSAAHRAFVKRVADGRGDPADPLTVVVTGTGALSSLIPPAQRSPFVPDDARYASFASRTGHPATAGWLRCPLPDLSEEDIGTLLEVRRVAVTSPDDARRLVHRLTGGQPRDTSLVLDAIAAVEPQEKLSLDAVLAATEDGLLKRLLREVPRHLHEDLVTCSAARDRDRMLQLAAQSALLTHRDLAQLTGAAGGLWRGEHPASVTLLRRLLLRRLARRPAGAPDGWNAVHTWLREDYERDRNETAVQYHRLAARQPLQVAKVIAKQVPTLPGGALVTLLHQVTVAPYPWTPAAGASACDRPADVLNTLVEGVDGLDEQQWALLRLVAGLWLDADPLFTTERTALHVTLAAAWNTLARHCPNDSYALLAEANRYDQLARGQV